jgi:hypothetical protein
MLLACAIFALLTVGFVGPCVIDIAMTPSQHFGVPSKKMWLIVAVAFWAFGAVTWLLVGRREVRMRGVCDEVSNGLLFEEGRGLWTSPSRTTGHRYGSGISQHDDQLATSRVRFIAPDDNPDFLAELERRIRDWREGL